MGLTKEQILSAEDRPVVSFSVPEWGGDIFLRALTSEEVQQCRIAGLDVNFKMDQKKTLKNHLNWAAMGICDASGMRIFTVEELASKSGAVIDRIASAIRKMNAADDGATQEAEKN